MKAGLGHKWDTHCLHHDDQYTVYYMIILLYTYHIKLSHKSYIEKSEMCGTYEST